MQLIQNGLIISVLLIISACSTSGSASGSREYNVQVGGWQDMAEYNHLREHAVEQTEREEDHPGECSIIDCPDKVRRDGTE